MTSAFFRSESNFFIRMLPLSEFVSDPRLKSDLEQATQDYARDLLKTPADTGSTDLQPQVNFAHYNHGSRVIWTSSVNRRCWYKSSWIFWKKKVCEDRRNHQNMLMPGSNPSDEFYMFGDNVRIFISASNIPSTILTIFFRTVTNALPLTWVHPVTL